MVVAGDVYRPAAREQLRVLAEQTEVGYYSEDQKPRPCKNCSASNQGSKS